MNKDMRNKHRFNYKIIWIAMLLTICIILVSNLIAINIVVRNMNSDLIIRNISIMGNLIDQHPELKNDILQAFLKENTAIDISRGMQTAGVYGYDTDMPVKIVPIVDNGLSNILTVSTIVFLVGFILLIILYYIERLKSKKGINLIAEAAEKIVEGDFGIKLPETTEGDYAKLSHEFNQMSKILQANLEKMKNEKVFLKNIISDISHQLKTPLSSLMMYNELLSDENMSKETQYDFIMRSQQQLERMEWLIINLLKMARIEAGAIEFQKKNNNIIATVNQVADNFKAPMEAKNIRLKLKYSTPDICFNYDDNWLKEAISNIIKNAIEHTNENDEIAIEVVDTPIISRLIISDTGKGIPKEDLPHIFERFYKGKNNIQGSGTGIGLALAKVIIENHNGLISVKSKESEGTVFTLTFPKTII